MLRKALQCATLAAATLLVCQGSGESQNGGLENRPTAISGISVPPVAGAPFSATVVIEDERSYFDGSDEVRRTISLIARDSKGRTHNETRRLMPESFHGSPPLLLVRIFDPETRIHIAYDPVNRIARRQLVPEQANVQSPPDPSIHKEDLGTTTFSGVPAKGTRRTQPLAGKGSGNGSKAVVEDEVWYSDELHLDMLVRHSDPRVGTQSLGVSNVKREEPPASMFEIPPGYRVVDAASNASPPSRGASSAAIP